jgi:4-oxalomesaconate tautomerase
MMMRGGTSKGAYFLRDDLPTDDRSRDDLLLRLLGSPDPRQIDGIGGAHPLTSKVAVVSRSGTDDADVDYLFLQVHVDEAKVSAGQPCGNILAGVAPFALERGLAVAGGDSTTVRIRMVNTGALAIARLSTPDGRVCYAGDSLVSGVPFPAAPIAISFADTEGSMCGSLVPTGNLVDRIDGLDVTCIDNGMPVVLASAADLGTSGYRSCADLEADTALRERLESLRVKAGGAMGLGDVSGTTVPKMTIVAGPRDGGALCTRTFIPHRCHPSIGVLAAVTVATAAAMPGTVAARFSDLPHDIVGTRMIRIEHPTGSFDTEVERGADGRVTRAAVLRTARKLFDGLTWPRSADPQPIDEDG